jgi:hypothetical protein
MAEKKLSLYQKLLCIQQEVIGLGKDSAGFGYRYVSGGKIIDHIKPLMNKHGILLKQETIEIENSRIDYTNKKGEPKSEMFTKARFKFTWIDTESGETDVNEIFANGMNEWEKGLGSAMTYAERYFLLKYFHINTDEDDIDNPERKQNEANPQSPPQNPQNPQISKEQADRDKAREIALKYEANLKKLEDKLNSCKTLEELTVVYNSLPPKWKKAALDLKNKLKNELTPKQAAK